MRRVRPGRTPLHSTGGAGVTEPRAGFPPVRVAAGTAASFRVTGRGDPGLSTSPVPCPALDQGVSEIRRSLFARLGSVRNLQIYIDKVLS
jgi:hypothetical protein